MQDNAMTSELVIQPLDNNRFHYISNQVIKSNLDDTSVAPLSAWLDTDLIACHGINRYTVTKE